MFSQVFIGSKEIKPWLTLFVRSSLQSLSFHRNIVNPMKFETYVNWPLNCRIPCHPAHVSFFKNMCASRIRNNSGRVFCSCSTGRFFQLFGQLSVKSKQTIHIFLALTCKTRRVRFPWNVLDAKHFSWRSSKLWKLRSLLSTPVSSTVVLNNSQIIYSLKSHFRFWLPETHFSVLYPYFFRYKFIFHDYLVLVSPN